MTLSNGHARLCLDKYYYKTLTKMLFEKHGNMSAAVEHLGYSKNMIMNFLAGKTNGTKPLIDAFITDLQKTYEEIFPEDYQ